MPSVFPFDPADTQPVTPSQSGTTSNNNYNGYNYGNSGHSYIEHNYVQSVDDTPGYKTTAFWLTVGTAIVSLLFVAGLINYDFKNNIESTLQSIIQGIIAVCGNTFAVSKYIKSRQQAKDKNKSSITYAYKSNDKNGKLPQYFKDKYGLNA